MIAVLNMDLEPVRLVLTNEVNRIVVCEDQRRACGTLYTVVAVTAPDVRRIVAGLIAGGAFENNGDFLGSATQGEALHLVFRYRSESLMTSREGIYGVDFVHRRTMAENFLAACAETQLPPDVAVLVLNGRCVNLSETGQVYFNYFLDFADYRPGRTEGYFCQTAASLVFDVLGRPYAVSTGGQIPQYPRELVAFFKKVQLGGFSTIGAILAAVRALPDHPEQPHRGLRLVWDRILGIVASVRQHSMAIFLAVLVCITLGYAAWQISMRISAQSAARENVSYGGVQTIGEVSLADENE
ncbi:hypothetical protein [uncultured Ruthenibacterium sp.]|uniref:hypothetical protein n=1 Tax=uncultured Ruthenibacterium sp. TaxID=1905347 RepID=UPI00349EA0C4